MSPAMSECVPRLNQYYVVRIKCLAQEHNTVPPVGLKSATPQSQVKHSTTEPLHV